MASPDYNIYYATAGGYYAYADKSGPYFWNGVNMVPISSAGGVFPGYKAGYYYQTVEAITATTTAVSSALVMYFTPFTVNEVISVVALAARVVTGGASSAFKAAIWETDPTTKRPTGLPIMGSNTEASTATSSTSPEATVSGQLLPGRVYWIGVEFKATLPTMLSISALLAQRGLGRVSVTGSLLAGLSTPVTYANDIMALDLTGATLSEVSATSGVPLMFLKTAA